MNIVDVVWDLRKYLLSENREAERVIELYEEIERLCEDEEGKTGEYAIYRNGRLLFSHRKGLEDYAIDAVIMDTTIIKEFVEFLDMDDDVYASKTRPVCFVKTEEFLLYHSSIELEILLRKDADKIKQAYKEYIELPKGDCFKLSYNARSEYISFTDDKCNDFLIEDASEADFEAIKNMLIEAVNRGKSEIEICDLRLFAEYKQYTLAIHFYTSDESNFTFRKFGGLDNKEELLNMLQ